MAAIADTLEFTITYKQKNITAALAPYVTSIRYDDKADNTADSIAIDLEDCDAYWLGKWYPVKTDEISLSFGCVGGPKINAGAFFIDQINIKAPPSKVTIEGIALTVQSDLKTKRTKAYENKTLKQIVDEIAGRHGLSVIGEIENLPIKRCTQNKLGDLEFLYRLAKDYGYVLAVKNRQLIFTKRQSLKKEETNTIITPSDCINYSFTDTTSKVYKACEVRYWDSNSRKMLSYTEKVKDLKTGDTLVIKDRLENEAQAKARAKAALTSVNDRQVTGNINIPGTVQYVAGAQLKLKGFGVLSGVYTIVSASHNLDKSGWIAKLSVSRNELKADDPAVERNKASGKSLLTGVSGITGNLTTNPNGWTTITDDDGVHFQCTNETAARFERLKQLVHAQWPGRAFWVSCTTGGTHSSPEHPGGRAIDCGVDGIGKSGSYTLESLAQQAGFRTFNEYINSSTHKTGDHMHIYI